MEERLQATIVETTLGDRARPPAEITERQIHAVYARG
jgi:hypothetical protein